MVKENRMKYRFCAVYSMWSMCQLPVCIVVILAAPTDEVTRAHLQPLPGQAKVKAEFTPRVVGTHCVQALMGSVEVEGSPFAVEAYDLHRIKLLTSQRAVVGQTCQLDGETSARVSLIFP